MLLTMHGAWLTRLENKLLGRRCKVVRREADWAIDLEGGGSISLPVPWRIIASGRIAFADQDDGQLFGLPASVDGEGEANRLIGDHPITMMLVNLNTADLTLHFGNELRLDAFNNSCGYEGWHISLNLPPDPMEVIALGGGELAIF